MKNLNWLTSQQALADIASFITSINQQHNIKGRWIALGESFLLLKSFFLKFPFCPFLDVSLRFLLILKEKTVQRQTGAKIIFGSGEEFEVAGIFSYTDDGLF